MDIDLRFILEGIMRKSGVKLPGRVIEASLIRGVLHVRFAYPRGLETDVEPLPLRTPTFLFRDERTGKITAIETVNVEELLKELNE